jgi:hypothetical protein
MCNRHRFIRALPQNAFQRRLRSQPTLGIWPLTGHFTQRSSHNLTSQRNDFVFQPQNLKRKRLASRIFQHFAFRIRSLDAPRVIDNTAIFGRSKAFTPHSTCACAGAAPLKTAIFWKSIPTAVGRGASPPAICSSCWCFPPPFEDLLMRLWHHSPFWKAKTHPKTGRLQVFPDERVLD